jgi:hypothetical protein
MIRATAPSSPSRGIAAARKDDQIWLGVGSWDNRVPGGLWSSYDAGATWIRDPVIESASDVAFVPTSTEGELVLAQSAYEDQWSSVVVNPHSPRLLHRALASTRWEDYSAPPHGQWSELEVCGLLDDSLVVRVDQTIHRRTKQRLWRRLRDLGFW